MGVGAGAWGSDGGDGFAGGDGRAADDGEGFLVGMGGRVVG